MQVRDVLRKRGYQSLELDPEARCRITYHFNRGHTYMLIEVEPFFDPESNRYDCGPSYDIPAYSYMIRAAYRK